MTKGIDLSLYQKKIDWSKVTADFAIIRAGYGRYPHQKDSMFESHYAGAKAAGIPVGVYWYSYAATEEDAAKEADACIAVLKGKQYAYPVYYDVEEKKLLDSGKKNVSAIIRTFLERVEAAGYWVGLYMSASPLSSLVDEDLRKRYSVWVAHVGVSKPAYKGDYGMWQYSWKGKIPGIEGDVDLDECYVDYPAKIREKGLNGFPKPDEPEPPAADADCIDAEITIGGRKYTGRLKAERTDS
ncbi:MAG: glycoside hydrolase family 25 protein [Oscillospiraceae bacterium]|nr:glycoside hydrolase family 25 protein [Oscillospiraceae bacterium]